MRFFIALEIPEEDREELKLVQQRLKELLPKVRLTDPDKLHLTLAFIGEQPDRLKEELIHVMDAASSGVSPFAVTPSYIDGFPNIHTPHTIWVGVKGDVDRLHLLHERLRDGLKRLNLGVDERRFIPHIALAKANGDKIVQANEEKLEFLVPDNLEPIAVTSIKLFESVPDQGLHKHNTLAEIRLS